MADLNLGTLYEWNKEAFKQEKPLDAIALNVCVNEMIIDAGDKSKYNKLPITWMLLCRERNDYTIFEINTIEGTIKEMKEVLKERGKVLSIDKQENGAYEIWLRDHDTEENVMYMFFECSGFIIKA